MSPISLLKACLAVGGVQVRRCCQEPKPEPPLLTLAPTSAHFFAETGRDPYRNDRFAYQYQVSPHKTLLGEKKHRYELSCLTFQENHMDQGGRKKLKNALQPVQRFHVPILHHSVDATNKQSLQVLQLGGSQLERTTRTNVIVSMWVTQFAGLL